MQKFVHDCVELLRVGYSIRLRPSCDELTIRALIVRIGFWGISYYKYNK